MFRFKPLKVALLALAGALMLAPAATQAATLTYTAGDLFLGFRKQNDTNVTSDYLVNIGQASIYRDATVGFTLSLGNIAADLTTLFGANWATNPDVLWGVVGTPGASSAGGDPANTLYATKAETTFGIQSAAYLRQSAVAQGNIRSDILSLVGSYIGLASTANSNFGLIQSTSATNSWASFNPGGISFSAFEGLEGRSATGLRASGLDLFRMTPTSTADQSGSYEGTFTISQAGQVSFLTSPVPEPTSGMLFILGTGCVAGFLRRRTAKA